jgi:hypothetical protein
MVKFNAAPAFDFDEWAALYRSDPAAFEARRRALLSIEIARSGEHAGLGKAVLERLEASLEGADDAQRLRLSMQAMADAARQLTEGLESLSTELREHAALRARLDERR